MVLINIRSNPPLLTLLYCTAEPTNWGLKAEVAEKAARIERENNISDYTSTYQLGELAQINSHYFSSQHSECFNKDGLFWVVRDFGFTRLTN